MLTEDNNEDIDLEELERARESRIALAKAAADKVKIAENEALENKKKRAEEKKKKRAIFLNDLDNFSTDFDSKIATQEQERLALSKREEELAISMQAASSNYVAPQSKSINKMLPPKPPIYEEEEVKANEESIIIDKSVTISSPSNYVNQKPEMKSILKENANNNYEIPVVEEELKMASRIGTGTGKSKIYASKSATTTISTSSTIMNESNHIEEDDEEEGTDIGLEHISNILSREERRKLSPQERAGWKAKQGDLNSKRKDFHGAVTYAFDGIFSWQMYGSAEAVDESGKIYTEYLMRCQWGTIFDNLQPWISARRYREFDVLNDEIKKAFPAYASNLPALPEKDYFRFLENDVVEKRRTALENYMSTIVIKFPSILKSSLIDSFLGIRERIAVITYKRGPDRTLTAGTNDITQVSEDVIDNIQARNDVEEYKSNENQQEVVLFLSQQDAENERERVDAKSLDEDELGYLEEHVHLFMQKLRNSTPNDVEKGSELYKLMHVVSSKWPQLRATAVVGQNVDFSLIPRAMQCEEDLERGVNEFKNLSALYVALSSGTNQARNNQSRDNRPQQQQQQTTSSKPRRSSPITTSANNQAQSINNNNTSKNTVNAINETTNATNNIVPAERKKSNNIIVPSTSKKDVFNASNNNDSVL